MAAKDIKDDETKTVPQETVDEIDGAIEDLAKKAEAERAVPAILEDGKTDLPAVEPEKGKKADEVHVDDEPVKPDAVKPVEMPDALVERAVKAGFSISEARAFGTASALERVCDTLEKKAKTADGDSSADDKEDKQEDDPLDSIPDLDPEEYDEKLVSIVKTLKGIVGNQQKTINELNAASREGKSRDEGTWFDGQIAGLGETVAKAVDADKRTALKDKLDILMAGYKAAGKEVAREAVFTEAAALVLGDIQKESESNAISSDLAKRGTQHIHRPSGVGIKEKPDAITEVADELDRKFFGKK